MSEEIEVAFGGPEEAGDGEVAATSATPDTFSKSAIRIVYQTNNFFVPQIQDLIVKGEALKKLYGDVLELSAQ